MSTFIQIVNRTIDYTRRPKNQDLIEVKALVNEAYVHVTSQLRCYQKTTAALALTAADGDYSIVTDLAVADFSTLRVVRYTAANGSSTLNTLAPSTPDEVMAMRAANPSATTPATTYALQGWDGLMLHPLPATGDTITLAYCAVPAALVADADLPSRIPQEWHHLIATRAAAVAMEGALGGGMHASAADLQRGQILTAQYEHELERARVWFNNHVGSRGFAPNTRTNRGLVMFPSDYFSNV